MSVDENFVTAGGMSEKCLVADFAGIGDRGDSGLLTARQYNVPAYALNNGSCCLEVGGFRYHIATDRLFACLKGDQRDRGGKDKCRYNFRSPRAISPHNITSMLSGRPRSCSRQYKDSPDMRFLSRELVHPW